MPLPATAISAMLYQGVMESAQWHTAIDSMCTAVGATVFHYFTLDPAGAPVPESVSNIDTAGLRSTCMVEYEQEHAANDLRMASVLQLGVGDVFADHEHISPHQMSGNSVYAGWLMPLGLKHTAAARTRFEGGAADYISFMRERSREPYGAPDKALLQQLMPHVCLASRLRARMVRLAREAALGLSALDSLAHGIVLVQACGRIQYANRAAEHHFNRPGPLQARAGRILCARPADQELLHRCLAGACAAMARAGAMRLTADSGGGTGSLAVSVLPVKAHHMLAAHLQIPLAMVVFKAGDTASALDPQAIAGALGLSPTEARLALLLVAGKTVKEFAAIEGMSWHTARSHIKNLMRKTGCHRQVELVQLFQSLHPH